MLELLSLFYINLYDPADTIITFEYGQSSCLLAAHFGLEKFLIRSSIDSYL